jgi:hypothetical protein
MKLHGSVPNFHIHVSMSDYIGLHILRIDRSAYFAAAK